MLMQDFAADLTYQALPDDVLLVFAPFPTRHFRGCSHWIAKRDGSNWHQDGSGSVWPPPPPPRRAAFLMATSPAQLGPPWQGR